MINELRKHDKRSQLELVREFVDLTGLDDTKMMINSKTGTVSITGRKTDISIQQQCNRKNMDKL